MIPRLSVFGGLKAGDLYIERPADAELLAVLKQGEYAYVLSSRQTGKTSLMLRTVRKLCALAYRCVKIDLGSYGSEISPEVFYLGIKTEIADALGLGDDFIDAAAARDAGLSPVHQFCRFLRDVLRLSDHPLVLFIDEIEGFQKFPARLTDDFLAAIRALYNDRDREPAYRRLSFCLLGVCTPNDIIRDERRTPFNVARSIQLDDLSWDSVRDGFLPTLPIADAEAILARIFHYTYGHPFMTHRLVLDAVERVQASEPVTLAWLEDDVRDRFLGSLRREHENILEVERRLCLGPDYRARHRIALYQSVRRGQRVPVSSRDLLQLELRLTGLVREEPPASQQDRPFLVVRNRIFATLFDEQWTPKNHGGQLDPAVWLSERVQHWLDLDRHHAAVLRSSDLHQAQRWAATQGRLDTTTEHFLAACERVDRQGRASRFYAILWTLLWSTFTTFLLAPLLSGYWQHRAYPGHAWLSALQTLPFVLALPCGLLADRFRLAPVHLLLSGLGFVTAGFIALTGDLFWPHRGLAFVALGLFTLGRSLQLPQAAVLVGLLYPRTDRRLDLSFVMYYFVVNLGALLGPLVGALAFDAFGWPGILGTGITASLLALFALAVPRETLLPLSLPIQTGSVPEGTPSPTRTLLLLLGVVLVFWFAFDGLSAALYRSLHAHTASSPSTAAARAVVTLSQQGITSLWILCLTPIFLGVTLLLRRFTIEPPAPIKLALGLSLLGVALLTSAAQTGSLPPRTAALLAAAEMLTVPATLSLTVALAPPGRLSTVMISHYLLTGLGGWLSEAFRHALYLPLAVVAGALALLLTKQRAHWPSFQPRPFDSLPSHPTIP